MSSRAPNHRRTYALFYPLALLSLASLSGCIDDAKWTKAPTARGTDRAEEQERTLVTEPVAFSDESTSPEPAASLEAKPSGDALAPLSIPSSSAPSPEHPPSPYIALEVPGFRPAVVSLPLGTTSRRPILVAAHGAGGRPEAQCSFFRTLVQNSAFVLCPRGYPLNGYAEPSSQGFFYPTHYALEREVKAALKALSSRFPEYVDERAPVYAGFSQGAIMGALFVVKRGSPFARALFIEGGVGEFDEWTIANARAFRESGGERVLLACGRPACLSAAQRTALSLAKAGLEHRVLYGEGSGHTYGGAVGRAIAEAFSWLVEDDSRFSSETPSRVLSKLR